MPRKPDRRSSLDFDFTYSGAGTTTITHNYDLDTTYTGEFPVSFEIISGDGYVDETSITKDDFDVISAAAGGRGRMKVIVAEY